jgi:hypothetical protein
MPLRHPSFLAYATAYVNPAHRSAETRLNAMANAIKSVRPALESFYAALDDEQKARFNMIGPPLSDPIDRQIRHAGRQRSAALQRLVIDFVKRAWRS